MTRAGVWGAGREGQAAALSLCEEGTDVVVVDEASRPRPSALDARAQFIAGPGALGELLACDFVVVSPGVPGVHPFRDRLRSARVELTSVTARWLARAANRTIGVTGTKGKSTTTTLIALLLRSTGAGAQLGGNIGVPLESLDPDAPVTVAELSSYQCASIRTAPRIAVVTSLYQDHLTWHGSKQAYWTDKSRIAGPGCEVLVCDTATLDALRSLAVPLPAKVVHPPAEAAVRIDAAPTSEILRLGQNRQNLALAVTAAEQWLQRPLDESELANAVTRFHPLPHRLEQVAERDGVRWIDDTLSTVPESVVAASRAFSGALTLIVGGEERGIDYAALTAHLLERDPLATVIALPSNGPRIVADYRAAQPGRVHFAQDLESAVRLAASVSAPGSVVALSPGAPSYDQYRDFEAKSAAYLAAIDELNGTSR